MRNEGNISKGEGYRGLCCRSAEGEHRQHQDLSTWESLHSLELVQRVVRTIVRRVGTSSLSLCWLDTRTSSWLGMWTMEELPSLTRGSSPATWLPPDGQGPTPNPAWWSTLFWPPFSYVSLWQTVLSTKPMPPSASTPHPAYPGSWNSSSKDSSHCQLARSSPMDILSGGTIHRPEGEGLRMALCRSGGKWAWTELRHAGGRMICIRAWGTLHWGTELKEGRKWERAYMSTLGPKPCKWWW